MPYAVARDGTELFYKDWGPRGGRAVVLIHGWPLNADSFDDAAVMLNEAGHRTIAYDRRGFGRSDQPATGYDYDTLADDLAAVIADAGLERPALAGFSMGGGEVVRHLSRGGEASAAVLIGAVTPMLAKTDGNPDGVPPEQLADMEVQLRADRADFLQTFGKQFYGVGAVSHPVSQATLDWTFGMAMMAGLVPTIGCMRAFATTDFRAEMARVTAPTLVIHGKDDKVVPIDPTARQAAKMIAGAKLVEIPGGPHGLLATHRQEVVEAINGFLKAQA